MQKAYGIAFGIVGTETVGTDEFSQSVGLMCWGRVTRTPHFGQADFEATPGKLPGRFTTSKPASNDMHVIIFAHAGAANKISWESTGKSGMMNA
jgi:hypothetical protein